MINYSLSMRRNPSDAADAKKAYATAQVTDILTIDDFAEHISEHHSKYGKGDIYCILTEMVSCMREQLLLGNKIQLGEMGSFYVSLKCKGAKTMADFNTATNIKKVNVNWTHGTKFKNLLDDAEFNQVITRKAQAAALKAANGTSTSTSASTSTSDTSTTGTSTDTSSTDSSSSGSSDNSSQTTGSSDN